MMMKIIASACSSTDDYEKFRSFMDAWVEDQGYVASWENPIRW